MKPSDIEQYRMAAQGTKDRAVYLSKAANTQTGAAMKNKHNEYLHWWHSTTSVIFRRKAKMYARASLSWTKAANNLEALQ